MLKVKLIPTGLLPTNTYLLFDDEMKNCLVIDPAYDNGAVLDFVEKHQLKLAAVLLTHGHFDHCGGVKLITDRFGVPVFGNEKDAAAAEKAAFNEWGVFCYNCKITDFVNDRDSFSVGGFSIDVLYTPGHTPGGVCYFIGDKMFSGDTLFKECIGRIDLPGGDYGEMMSSLKKISGLDKDYFVYPGHEETTTLFHEFEFNPYLAAFKRN